MVTGYSMTETSGIAVSDYTPQKDGSMGKCRTGLQVRLPTDPGQFPRPTWILAKPIQLLMRNHRPFYGSPLRTVSTPERIEAGWWDEAQSRDYFIAEGTDHTLYWIYRERVVIESGEREPRWFLHGLFG
jgi:protein ImuB